MRIRIWLRTECKRALACVPTLILKAVILAFTVSMTAFCAYQIWMNNQKEAVKIGYSAPEDRLTQMAISYIENMEALQGWCSLVPVSKEAGLEAVDNGELAALLVLPNQVVEGIMDGTNEPAKLYLSGQSQALGYVFEELASAGVGMLAVAQAQIYATDDILSAAGADRSSVEEQYKQLDLHNLDVVMNRERIFKDNCISPTGTVGVVIYYVSAFLCIYMLTAGLFYAKYCMRTTEEERITYYRLGVPYAVQAIGRNIVTACLTAILAVLPFVMLLTPACRRWVSIPQLTVRGLVVFGLLLLCIGAYTQLMCRAARFGSMTLPVICMLALIQGYVSGCFLPTAILPRIVEKISWFIPATYIKAGFTVIFTGKRQQLGQICTGLICWSVLFTAVTILLMYQGEKKTVYTRIYWRLEPGTSLSAVMFRRLLKRKSFWGCLIITSLLSCVMIHLERKSDTVLHAVYYTENESLRQTLASYEGLTQFEAVDSQEEVRRQVLLGKAECGYVITDNIVQRLQSNDADRMIQVWESEDALFTDVMNEVLFSRLYTQTASEWYAQYMEKLYGEEYSVRHNEAVKALFRHLQDGSTFTFERQVMQPAVNNSGEVTYPVWIIMVFQTVLCGLSGAIMSIRDHKKQYYYKRSYPVMLLLSIVQPMILSGLAGAVIFVFYNSY